MSAKGKNIDRVKQDSYQTPPEVVDAIMPYIAFRRGDIVLEPCRGKGNIYDAIPRWTRRRWCELRDGRDYLARPKRADIIITNPPFSRALEFLEKSLQEAETVIYLLRINFLGSSERRPFWIEHPPTHLFVITPRPSFIAVCQNKACRKKYAVSHRGRCRCGSAVSRGSDATEYAWYVWDRGGRINTDHWLNYA